MDVRELKDAMLRASSAGEHEAGFGAGLTEREIDTVIGEFAGRKAFGIGGGLGRMEKRGDVFRYKDFVGAVGGNAGAETRGGGVDAGGVTA